MSEHEYIEATVVRAKDGSLHESLEQARQHDKRKELETSVHGYVKARNLKGRGKRSALDIGSDLLLWIQAGRPDAWPATAE